MYMTETTDNVKKLFEKIDNLNDLMKMKLLLYVFNALNNNQINDKNIVNPDLESEEDIKIFTMQDIGFPANYCTIFLQYNIMVYNIMTNSKEVYEDQGNVIGITYNEKENELITDFEHLNFEEKLDVISELIIKYDNETFFKEKITMLTFDSSKSGFDIAKSIKDYKKNIKN